MAATGPIQLYGTILAPDGTPANGFFLLRLNTFSSLLPGVGTGGILPNFPITVRVQNGQVISPSNGIYGNDTLVGTTWYVVQFWLYDHVFPLFTQNWYIIGNAPFNMASAQAVTVTPPDVLAFAQYVLSLNSVFSLSPFQLTPNGTAGPYTIPSGYAVVYRNGAFLTPGVDYSSPAADEITFNVVPGITDVVSGYCIVTVDGGASGNSPGIGVINSIQMRDQTTGTVVTLVYENGSLQESS